MYGLTAAALFGASTPFAKAILNDVHPIVLAGLLYAGSGLGLIAGRQCLWTESDRHCAAVAPRLGLARCGNPGRRNPWSGTADVWSGNDSCIDDFIVTEPGISVHGAACMVSLS
jgi:hypothetical protein